MERVTHQGGSCARNGLHLETSPGPLLTGRSGHLNWARLLGHQVAAADVAIVDFCSEIVKLKGIEWRPRQRYHGRRQAVSQNLLGWFTANLRTGNAEKCTTSCRSPEENSWKQSCWQLLDSLSFPRAGTEMLVIPE